jgi:hypothetical protein
MEELLKFLSAPQSVRNRSFMYLWRVLMSVLLTNEVMLHYKYTLTDKEISINVIVTFILSPEFLLVIYVYLIFTFLFFWFLKIIGALAMFLMSKNQLSFETICYTLEKLKIVSQANNQHGFIINDSGGEEAINNIIDDKDVFLKSIVLSRTADYVNVIFSSAIFYFQIYQKIPHLPGLYFGIFLVFLCLISLLIAFSILFFYSKSNLLQCVRDTLLPFGYLNQ